MELKLVLVPYLCLCVTQIHSSNDQMEHANVKEFDVKRPNNTRIKYFSDDFLASMCNLTQCSKEITNTAPWIPSGYLYRLGVDGLHTEIEHFNTYMRATSTEHALRVQVVKRIEFVVLEIWPNARVEVFGSFRSGIFLPNSDIDLDVFNIRDRFPLRVLEAKLLASNIAELNSIVVVERTIVPIIRFIDGASKLKVDIAFNKNDIAETIKLIDEYKRKFPVVPKLVMVLKQFLTLHNLNDAYTGGLSSFALCLMCINFLQLQPAYKLGENANLGILLLGFLELYGKKFDYDTNCIRITNGGQYVAKENALRLMMHDQFNKFLCIEDPLDPRKNVARKTYRAHHVTCVFENAFTLLSNAITPIQNGNDCPQHRSTLGRIIHGTKKLIEYRQWIRKIFEQTLN